MSKSLHVAIADQITEEINLKRQNFNEPSESFGDSVQALKELGLYDEELESKFLVESRDFMT